MEVNHKTHITFVHLKLLPGERLPHSAGDGAEQTHAHQEEHDLKSEIGFINHKSIT